MNARLPAGLLLSLLLAMHNATAATLSDPTQPSGTPQMNAAGADSGMGGWRLNATHITSTKRLAVINGTRVAEGDLIGSARVLRVSHAQVKLDAQGEILTLRLLQAEVKKTR